MTRSDRLAGAAFTVAVLLTFGGPLVVKARVPQLVDRDRFEVASVKLNTSGGVPDVFAFQPGGRFTAANATMRELIRLAYDIQPSQLIDGPAWITSSRFDIVARAEVEGRPSLVMLRHLLEERFKLATHRETRELPLYALVMARADRRFGPQLRVSTVDCAAVPASPSPDGRQYCDGFVGAAPRWLAGGVTMAQVALALSRQVRATVVDRTGLMGTFDVELQWTPEGLPRPPGAAIDLPLRLNGFVVDPNGPSITSAVEDQLGLKLESRKGPVDVVVIDSVIPPSPD